MQNSVNSRASLEAQLIKAAGLDMGGAAPKFRYDFECRDKDGNLKWTDSFENLVTTQGKNDLLDKYFAGSAYTAAWYLGLISSVSYTTGPAVGDTAANMNTSNAWREAQGATNLPDYVAGTRPAISFGTAASGGSKTAAAAVSFTFSSGGTVKGAFIGSTNTKGATTGILYSAGTFTDKVVATNDVLNVTVTVSA
jgi:hypothetical protein